MKIRHIITIAILAGLSACSDDDSFTQSPTHLLTFSQDSIKLDTVFSNVPTVTRDFWVYNQSGDGIRCTNIRLERGNQSGFRVNVDGFFLGASTGFQTSNVEIRNKDSLRVFVEATTPYNYHDTPQLVEDNLLFTLESGVTQKVNLNAYSWDAQLLHDVHIEKDSVLTFGEGKPIIVYGGILVDSTATLTLPPGTTLYFHADAGIDVYGRLLALGQPDQNVTLRGDRIDRMFDNLPYDQVSGQWQGIHFHTSSYENLLEYTDIHSAFNGIVADSSDVNQVKFTMRNSTVHNCQGYGIHSISSHISLTNCQLSNTLEDCLSLDGGRAIVNACTIAQFYPFTAYIFQGAAIHVDGDAHPLEMFICQNTLVTGAVNDVLLIVEPKDTTQACNYRFSHCILRTTAVEDSIHFGDVTFEDPDDTTAVSGRKHFVPSYDYHFNFQLDSISTAIDNADPATSPANDRNGRLRDERPDIGAYEYLKE